MSDCDAVIDQAQDINSVNTGGLGVFKNIYANSKMRVGLEDFANHGFYSANSYTFVCPGWDRNCVSDGTKVSRDTYPGYPNDEIWGYLACDNNGCWTTGAAGTREIPAPSRKARDEPAVGETFVTRSG